VPLVELDADVYERLVVTGRLMDRPLSDVIRRLLELVAREQVSAKPSTNTSQEMEHDMRASMTTTESERIYGSYKGHRIEGRFDLSTHEVVLDDAPWANKPFSSPTAAARAVVEHFSGDTIQASNTNGRRFWRVVRTRRDLRSLIGER
jgi:predicted CopG family antitoxin